MGPANRSRRDDAFSLDTRSWSLCLAIAGRGQSNSNGDSYRDSHCDRYTYGYRHGNCIRNRQSDSNSIGNGFPHGDSDSYSNRDTVSVT